MDRFLLAVAAALFLSIVIVFVRRLAFSAKCLEQCLDSAGVALVWVNLQSQKIIRVNQTFASFIGLTVEEFPGRWIGAYLSSGQIQPSLNLIGDGKPFPPIEVTMCVASQPELVVSLMGVPLRRCKTGVLIIRDLTEQKLVANRLLQSQKMEALGTLAGGVAHDFNNLLQVIIGFSERIADRATGTTLEAVKKVQLASIRAGSLVSQLLIFSRRQPIQPRLVDVNTILADMNGMMRPLLGSGIELVVVMEENLPSVLIDVGQIESSLMNLIINAMHALEGKPGRISLETFVRWLPAESLINFPDGRREEDRMGPGLHEGNYVVIRISDTGCGMSPELLLRIFEPFFTTKKIGKGTGLGLCTVYGAVKQNHGDVRVQSQVGVGTTFEILLPAAHAKETAPMLAAEPELVLEGNERLLIVEDEPMIRSLLQRILQDRGYTVFCCANGSEALRLTSEQVNSFDVLVTDLIMPIVGGTEVSIELRKINPRLRTLYISGFNAEISHMRGLSRGESFLEKPFSDKVLCRALRELITVTPSEPAVFAPLSLP
jgi:two-component system, cell cycle sensor histidine kinase and response regulator CckA